MPDLASGEARPGKNSSGSGLQEARLIRQGVAHFEQGDASEFVEDSEGVAMNTLLVPRGRSSAAPALNSGDRRFCGISLGPRPFVAPYRQLSGPRR